MKACLRIVCLCLFSACLIWAAVPRVISVEPNFGKNGEDLVINGENLDNGTVAKLFLTGNGEDHEVSIKEQTAGKIRFTIPAKLALGDYTVTVQTGGDSPALLEQPVSCSVVDEAGAKKMAEGQKDELEVVEQKPEEPAAPKKK